MVLGDLPENEARDFVLGAADNSWPGIVNNPQFESLPAPACSEDQWREIYDHCGGNIWLFRVAPHYVVLQSQVEKELDKGSKIGGELILRSMVKYNLLALRCPSDLARDLPLEVYGDIGKPVVTLHLPSYVWAAKKLLKVKTFVEACEQPSPATDDNPAPL